MRTVWWQKLVSEAVLYTSNECIHRVIFLLEALADRDLIPDITKKPVGTRLDDDLLAELKEQGEGGQVRINQTLYALMVYSKGCTVG